MYQCAFAAVCIKIMIIFEYTRWACEHKWTGQLARIFVSYNSKDKEIVQALVDDIEAMGYEVWFDTKLSAGQIWWDRILERIRECDIFCFAVSPDALNSSACNSEIDYADALGKPILPILIVDISINILPSPLSKIQFSDYRVGDKAAVLGLANALASMPGSQSMPVLPPEPSAPISYLGEIAKRIDAKSLNIEEQSFLVIELKSGLRDPDMNEDSRALLKRLRNRTDIAVKIREELDDCIKSFDNVEPEFRVKVSEVKNIQSIGENLSQETLRPSVPDKIAVNVGIPSHFQKWKLVLVLVIFISSVYGLLVKRVDPSESDLITTGDTLELFVKGFEDLSESVPVRADGKIKTRLVREVVAIGKTSKQLASELENLYKEYVSNPTVTITTKKEPLIEEESVIGPYDTLDIIVWGYKELSALVPVRPDGRVTIKLIEDVVAIGNTPTSLALELEGLYSLYVKKPKVIVKIDKKLGGHYAKSVGKRKNSQGQYTIGVGDALDLFVWGYKDLSVTTSVGTDGKITTRLVENLAVVDKTPTQVARELEQVYRTYIKNPKITVAVTEFGVATSQPTKISNDKVVLSGRALFPYNSYKLSSQGERELALLIEKLRSYQDIILIDLVGHTDSRGSLEDSQELSEKRASTIFKALQLAFPDVPITSSGLGKSAPVASNDTALGRRLNRRVEIRVEATE